MSATALTGQDPCFADTSPTTGRRTFFSEWPEILAALGLLLLTTGWTTNVSTEPTGTAGTVHSSVPSNPQPDPDDNAQGGPVWSGHTQSAPPRTIDASPRRPLSRAASGAAVALGASIEGNEKRTKLLIDLSRGAALTAFCLANPYRVIIDLNDVVFQLAAGSGTLGHGLIKGYRYGSFAQRKSRIVIETTGPVLLDRSLLAPVKSGGQTMRLTLELVPTDTATFGARIANQSAQTMPDPATLPLHKTLPAFDQQPEAEPVIVIDPGHGGIDAGTVGSSKAAEKDVVLVVARLLHAKLSKSRRYAVYLTRESDVFVPLDDRVRFAREHGAALFISLHTDSLPNKYAHLNIRGATLYTAAEKSSDPLAQDLADKENLSDVLAGAEGRVDDDNDVTDILIDLLRRETANNSLMFTKSLMSYMRQATILNRDPHRFAAFRVLRAPDVPSVLIELGYLSNREDETLLLSKSWQEKIADSVVRGVDAYFGGRVARTPH